MYKALLPIVSIPLLLAGCQKAQEPSSRLPDGPAVAERVMVLSADALVIDGKHVRLSNAFAPEPVPRARCWAEAAAAKQATRLVQNMILNAETIQVTPTGGVDEYNRTYAQVRLEGLDLGQSLFDDGFAGRPQTGRRFEWCERLSKNDPGGPTLWSLMELKPR